ncbi:MAG: TetR/AcrR family transcriptional regulator [Erysipelotrichaceae bacterium]|nr:TetR/AcrR family transcriptional regulator [Erysipelotrichaceae bacterium]
MDRRFQKTEKAIRSAYFSLLGSGRKITVTEIAERADIDRKTFYLHYQSVEDIVTAYAKEKVQQLKDMLKEKGFFTETHDLYVFFQCLNELMSEDIRLYRSLSKDRNYEFFWETVHQIIKKTVTDLFTGLSAANEREFQTYVDFYTYGVISVYRRWLEANDNMSLEELGRYLGEISSSALRIYRERQEK